MARRKGILGQPELTVVLVWCWHNPDTQQVRVWRNTWPGDTWEIIDTAQMRNFVCTVEQLKLPSLIQFQHQEDDVFAIHGGFCPRCESLNVQDHVCSTCGHEW